MAIQPVPDDGTASPRAQRRASYCRFTRSPRRFGMYAPATGVRSGRCPRSCCVKALERELAAVKAALSDPSNNNQRIEAFRRLWRCRKVTVLGNTARMTTPVLLLGERSITIGDGVQSGYERDQFFLSGYILIDARRDAHIEIGAGAVINNNSVLIAEGEGIEIGPQALIGASVQIFDTDFHNLDRAPARPRLADEEGGHRAQHLHRRSLCRPQGQPHRRRQRHRLRLGRDRQHTRGRRRRRVSGACSGRCRGRGRERWSPLVTRRELRVGTCGGPKTNRPHFRGGSAQCP